MQIKNDVSTLRRQNNEQNSEVSNLRRQNLEQNNQYHVNIAQIKNDAEMRIDRAETRKGLQTSHERGDRVRETTGYGAYNPDHTRYCTYCGRTGHTKQFCWREKEDQGLPINLTGSGETEYDLEFPQQGRRGTPPERFRPDPERVSPEICLLSTPGSPGARTQEEREEWQDKTKAGYHYPEWYRNTGNSLVDNYRFANRRDSGWAPAIERRRDYVPNIPNPRYQQRQTAWPQQNWEVRPQMQQNWGNRQPQKTEWENKQRQQVSFQKPRQPGPEMYRGRGLLRGSSGRGNTGRGRGQETRRPFAEPINPGQNMQRPRSATNVHNTRSMGAVRHIYQDDDPEIENHYHLNQVTTHSLN
jgi:hypothetical protein